MVNTTQKPRPMGNTAQRLFGVLQNCALNDTTMTYREAADAIGMEHIPNMALPKVIGGPLGEINDTCLYLGWPLLGALIVRTSGNNAGYPGDGFYRLAQNLGVYCPNTDSLAERQSFIETYLTRVWNHFGPHHLYPV
jgi:hypothetical protein